MPTQHLAYWLAAIYLPSINPRHFLRWLDYFPNIENLFNASSEEYQAIGITKQQEEMFQHPDWKSVEKDLAWMQQPHHHIICLADEAYPTLLKEITDPPLVLYIRGNKSALNQMQLAIVGSRHATPSGMRHAEEFSYHLAETGLTITSGLAQGIDSASHRGALAANGVTIAVAGTGLHHTYPRSHVNLAEDIINHDGAVISEFPLATPPRAANFPRRNRIIGGLSIGVLVVEAALKSGSLITARHALEQGREVFAIPGPINNPLTRGCHHLIRQGAKLVETANDIIEELGSYNLTLSTKQPEIPVSEGKLSPECRQLLEQIEYEITPIDMILLRSGLTAGKVSSMLLVLELSGYIQSAAGGYIRL